MIIPSCIVKGREFIIHCCILVFNILNNQFAAMNNGVIPSFVCGFFHLTCLSDTDKDVDHYFLQLCEEVTLMFMCPVIFFIVFVSEKNIKTNSEL